MHPFDENHKYACPACGTPVYSNRVHQVRQQSDDAHHNYGGDTCIGVFKRRITEQHESLVELMRHHIDFQLKVDALVHTLCPGLNDEANATGPLKAVIDAIRGSK